MNRKTLVLLAFVFAPLSQSFGDTLIRKNSPVTNVPEPTGFGLGRLFGAMALLRISSQLGKRRRAMCDQDLG